jgi:hypothetical protein
MFRTILLILVLFVVPAWPQVDLSDLQREYSIIATKLQLHTDGFSVDSDPASSNLLERKWQITAEWIAHWLDHHPRATEKQVTGAYSSLDSGISASALLLAPRTYLITVQKGEIGTVFVVAADAAAAHPQFDVRWTIRDAQLAFADELAAWKAEKASGTCRNNRDDFCGPLYAQAIRLPDTVDGHPRFCLDTTYAQAVGFTVGKQLSIWEWRGSSPLPLRIKSFSVMIDQAEGTKLEGDVLHVGEKAFFRSFFGCGGCEERQLDWALRITPTEIQDLGERSLVPELDSLDEVVYRLAHGQSASNLASDQVIETLQDIVDDAKEDIATWNKEKDDYFSLGMLMHQKVSREGGETFLCFSTDNVGPLRFRMQPNGDGFYLQEVQDLSDQPENTLCPFDPPNSSPKPNQA